MKASIEEKKALKITEPQLGRRLMYALGTMAKTHFLLGFRKGGGQTDASQGGWPPRKRNYHYEKRGNKWKRVSDVGRALLIQSGTLRRSIGVLKVTKNTVSVGTRGVRYAAIHNFGLQGRAFGKHPFRMPKREFIGRSKVLERRLEKYIQDQIEKQIKNAK